MKELWLQRIFEYINQITTYSNLIFLHNGCAHFAIKTDKSISAQKLIMQPCGHRFITYLDSHVYKVPFQLYFDANFFNLTQD